MLYLSSSLLQSGTESHKKWTCLFLEYWLTFNTCDNVISFSTFSKNSALFNMNIESITAQSNLSFAYDLHKITAL